MAASKNPNSLQKALIVLVLIASVSAASVTNVVTLKDVLDAANAIRANPSSYANVVKTQIRDLQDEDGVIWSWGSVGLAFNEGTAAVDEAITFLQNATPKPALTLDQGLVRSSWEHSKYQVEINQMTHTGPAGRSGLTERFNLYNQGVAGQGNSWAENIADAHQDWYRTATLLCLQWIIDDGVPSRGHRTNFFNSNALKVGIGIYPYTKSNKKRDRVTMFYAQNSVCKNCDTFTKEINDSMCWSNFAANQSSCDPAQVPTQNPGTGGETNNPGGETNNPGGETNNPGGETNNPGGETNNPTESSTSGTTIPEIQPNSSIRAAVLHICLVLLTTLTF